VILVLLDEKALAYLDGKAQMTVLVQTRLSSNPTFMAIVPTVFASASLHSLPMLIPTVTSVGATTIAWGNHSLETAAWDYWYNKDNDSMLYTSGGGFSNIYGSPAYQAAAVARYFGIAKPRYKSSETLDGFEPSKAGPGQYNRIGRGIPDVAALGQDIGIYVKGKLSTDEMGTSASCPIFASVITRINDARMNMGKTVRFVRAFHLVALSESQPFTQENVVEAPPSHPPKLTVLSPAQPVGFINPVLYANPHVLNDITNGSNPVSETPFSTLTKSSSSPRTIATV